MGSQQLTRWERAAKGFGPDGGDCNFPIAGTEGGRPGDGSVRSVVGTKERPLICRSFGATVTPRLRRCKAIGVHKLICVAVGDFFSVQTLLSGQWAPAGEIESQFTAQ